MTTVSGEPEAALSPMVTESPVTVELRPTATELGPEDEALLPTTVEVSKADALDPTAVASTSPAVAS
jgi:hypothetical protein